MYKIPLLERVKDRQKMNHCKGCFHLYPTAYKAHCYMFRSRDDAGVHCTHKVLEENSK